MLAVIVAATQEAEPGGHGEGEQLVRGAAAARARERRREVHRHLGRAVATQAPQVR